MADKSIYESYEPKTGNSQYLKLKDGERVIIRIASEPAVYTSTFGEGENKKISTRFAWTVWNRDEEKAQVFQGGANVFNQVKALVEAWGDDPTDFDINVKREGEGLDTKWTLTTGKSAGTALTDAQQTECDGIDLLDKVKGHWLRDFDDSQDAPAEDNFDQSPPPNDEDAPIDLNEL